MSLSSNIKIPKSRSQSHRDALATASCGEIDENRVEAVKPTDYLSSFLVNYFIVFSTMLESLVNEDNRKHIAERNEDLSEQLIVLVTGRHEIG